MFNHFCTRHADTIVADRDFLLLFIYTDSDRRMRIVGKQGRIVDCGKTQLVDGVRSVGHQFTQENLAVGIKRMHHQMEHLFHLGLETERLFLVFRH